MQFKRALRRLWKGDRLGFIIPAQPL